MTLILPQIGGWYALPAPTFTDQFAMTVATTGANEVFTIPCQDVGVFSATVDWGDGATSTITTYNDTDLAHTYASASAMLAISSRSSRLITWALWDGLG